MNKSSTMVRVSARQWLAQAQIAAEKQAKLALAVQFDTLKSK